MNGTLLPQHLQSPGGSRCFRTILAPSQKENGPNETPPILEELLEEDKVPLADLKPPPKPASKKKTSSKVKEITNPTSSGSGDQLPSAKTQDKSTRFEQKLRDFQDLAFDLIDNPTECSPVSVERVRKMQKLVASLYLDQKISSLDLTHGRKLLAALAESIGIGLSPDTKGVIKGSKLPDAIQISCDAALITLYFLADESVVTSMVLDESITNVCELLKRFLNDFLFPLYDPSYVKKEDPVVNISSPLKKEILTIANEITRFCSILLARRKLSDSHVLSLILISLTSIFIDIPSSLHLLFVDLICIVFRKYPSNREVILDDLCSSLAKLPKKCARQFKVREKKSIQLYVALLLRLVQCCTGLQSVPSDTVVNFSDLKKRHPDTPIDDDKAGYLAAIRSSEQFLEIFLRSCFQVRKGKESKGSEFRNLFANFFDDLLECWLLPEWPGAELLLEVALGKLMTAMKSNKDNLFRSFALQLIGKYAARIRRELGFAEDETMLFFTPSDLEPEENALCLCKKGWQQGEEMIQCDQCKSWFHFECVNVDAKIASRIWTCENCLLSALITEYKKGFTLPEREGEPSEEWDEEESVFVAQQVLHQYLLEGAFRDESINEARHFLLSQWNQDAAMSLRSFLEQVKDSDEEKSPLCALLSSEIETYISKWILQGDDYGRSASKLSPTDALKVSRYIFCHRPVVRENFEFYTTFLINHLGDDHVSIRRDAMKALTAIIEVDPDILGEENMKNAVAVCLRDTAKAVRRQAVDLVGGFISLRPALAAHYIDIVMERSRDVGVSVRKSAVGILQTICGSDPEAFGSKVCLCLVRRMEDIKPIKKKVFETFRSIWFKDLPDETDMFGRSSSLSLEKRIQLIIDVVLVYSNCEWLVKLFRQQISDASTKEKAKVHELCGEFCEALVNCFVSSMGYEAKNNEEKLESIRYSLACITALEVFSRVDASLLCDHIGTLSVYLKSILSAADPVTSKLLASICVILERSVPELVNPSTKDIIQIERDLNNIIYRVTSPTVVRSAIRCLARIVTEVSEHYGVIRILFDEFAICFLNYAKNLGWKPPSNFSLHINPNPSQEKRASVNLVRSLFGLGMICRYYDVDSLESSECQRSSMVLELYKFILHPKREQKNENLKAKAIQGFTALWSKNPQIMVDCRSLIHSFLRSKVAQHAEEALKGLLEVLTEEKDRVLGVDDKKELWDDEDEEDDDEFLIAPVTGDIDILGPSVQHHMEDLINLLIHPQHQVREGALGCVRSIIEQGLTHPGECVPNVIALLADANPRLADQGRRLMLHLERQYPDFFWSRFTDGLRSLFRLHLMLSAFGDKNRGQSVPCREGVSILNPIYEAAREKRQLFQERFVPPIVSRFSIEKGDWKNPKGLFFVASMLASIPFRVEEEVLHVIYHINQLISLQACGALVDLEKSFIAKGKTPEQHTRDVIEKGRKVFASMLLITVKKVLRMTFRIDADKCQNYQVFKNLSSNKPCERSDFAKCFKELEQLSEHLIAISPNDSDLDERIDSCRDLCSALTQQLEEDDDDFNEHTWSQNKKGRRAPRSKQPKKSGGGGRGRGGSRGKSVAKKMVVDSDDSSEDECTLGELAKKMNRSRRSKAARSYKAESSEEEDESDEDNVVKGARKRGRKKEDEDFEPVRKNRKVSRGRK